MSKPLFWINVKWVKGGERFSLLFLVASHDIEAAQEFVVKHLAAQGISAATGISFKLNDCWCCTSETKIIESTPL